MAINVSGQFYKVTVIEPNIDLRRYNVVWGELKERGITKSDLKLTLIEVMLVIHPPSAAHNTSDDSLHFVPVGNLYNDCSDDMKLAGTVICKSFNRPTRPGAPGQCAPGNSGNDDHI
ncbi:b72df63d-4200-4e25-9bde-ebf16d54b655 [Sclerotinia trifoliorum]|uniref:B72df63d-4200-4e25-9bde-ebf16d54b655 n=1 Tax=Sclerotinia trifoliorum TaxID=28548 RepID=A0A8H2W436_9HELO|nr:b72df63d-4200-4e25-9bde-ebf16d54b655 [Sclerotinia trifoliorum]